MSWIERMPPALESALAGRGGVEVAVAADLTAQGRFGQEWLVVTRDTLEVYPLAPEGAPPAPRLSLPLAALRSPRALTLVGGGALTAVVDGCSVELLRYTNAAARAFERVAKYLADLDAFLHPPPGSAAPPRPTLDPDPNPPRRCPECNRPLREGTRVCPHCLNRGRVLLRLMGCLRPYWARMTAIWLLLILSIGLSMVPPYLTRPLMDNVLAPAPAAAAPGATRLAWLGWLTVALLASQALAQVVGVMRSRLIIDVGTSLAHRLRMELYERMQFLSLRFFDKRSTGALLTRVTQDTQSLEDVVVDGMQHFVVQVLSFFAIGALLAALNWRLTLLVLLPVPLVILLSRRFFRGMRRLWQRNWHCRSQMAATVSDALGGVRVVKAFGKEAREVERFDGRSNDLREAGRRAEQAWATLFPTLWFIAGSGSLIVWYVGGREVLGGAMSLGTLLAFQSFLAMFYAPLQYFSRMADYMARSLTATERVFEILDMEPEVRDAPDAVSMPEVRGRVEFRHVTFGYEAHRPVLKDISLCAEPGELIGLVGHSGAGKSTAINLLCRLYDPQEGALFVDGTDVRCIRQADLRSRIGIVLQDTFLFNGTIAENIAYARPGARPEEIMASAKTANAHDFIVAKPDGYDTRVGERGQALSAGERQRVAIARAILHNPRILILDEATASVDTSTEQQIQEAIGRLVKGRTTFAIAHRLNTLRRADRLVVLKNGCIEESGTHAELLAREGAFSRMVQAQREMSAIVEVAE
jgi:ATP-binding cassette subfamily B protein